MKYLLKVVILITSMMLLGMSATFGAVGLKQAEAASVKKIKTTEYQTTSKLNMRTGASTSYKKKLTIPKDSTVKAYRQKGSWYKVSYTYTSKGKQVKKYGWVSRNYLEKKPGVKKIKTTSYHATINLNMRSGGGLNYSKRYKIPKGSLVKAYRQQGNWYKVSYTYTSKGKKVKKYGWVSGKYLDKPKEVKKIKTTPYQTSINLNMRTGAGLYFDKRLKIPKGSTVKAYRQQGDWYKVSYVNKSNVKKYGWVSGKYLVVKEEVKKIKTTPYYTTINLNMRSGAGTSYSKRLNIPKGSTVKAYRQQGNWYKVSYVNKSNVKKYGWVSGKYLDKVHEVKSMKTTPFTTTINLNMRSGAGTYFSKRLTIPKGSLVKAYRQQGDWYKVSYVNRNNKKKYGWVSGKYLTENKKNNTDSNKTSEEIGTRTAYLVTANLNMRKSDSTSTAVLSTIPKGTTVYPSKQTTNGWYKVSYNGKSGYVSGSYVREYSQKDSYQFIDLRTTSSVKAKHINSYIANRVGNQKSVLTNKGQAFIDAGKKYGVNPLFLAAHAIHESAYGMSGIALSKKNLFGYGAFDSTPFVGAYKFNTIEANIDYVAQKIKYDYLSPNGKFHMGPFLGYKTNNSNGHRVDSKTVGMNYFYATDPNWGNAIAQHMEKILPYDKAYYKNAKIDTSVPAYPGIPAGSEAFPDGIIAEATKDFSSIKKGSTFELLEKSNDYRLKVKYEGKTYWTGAVAFSKYYQTFEVLNLGRVNATSLNVRSGASTNYGSIGILERNEYVQLVLDKKNKVTMNSDKTWYKVKLSNGKIGWVSAKYIIKELD